MKEKNPGQKHLESQALAFLTMSGWIHGRELPRQSDIQHHHAAPVAALHHPHRIPRAPRGPVHAPDQSHAPHHDLLHVHGHAQFQNHPPGHLRDRAQVRDHTRVHDPAQLHQRAIIQVPQAAVKK